MELEGDRLSSHPQHPPTIKPVLNPGEDAATRIGHAFMRSTTIADPELWVCCQHPVIFRCHHFFFHGLRDGGKDVVGLPSIVRWPAPAAHHSKIRRTIFARASSTLIASPFFPHNQPGKWLVIAIPSAPLRFLVCHAGATRSEIFWLYSLPAAP